LESSFQPKSECHVDVVHSQLTIEEIDGKGFIAM
jgi:hypothetical protein